MPKLKVLIAGAGLGGLCLAQILRRANVEVHVFERDATPWDRPQGYRLHIDADGINALWEALPPELYELFDATAMHASPYTTVVNTALEVQRRIPIDAELAPHRGAAHFNVNRATLRQLLLTGLDGACHFGARLEGYQSGPHGVTALFADGSRVQGDVLVGADGIRSAVRRQLLPDAQVLDTGVRAIYGRIPIEAARNTLSPQAMQDVFTTASDERKVFFGLGPVVFPVRPESGARRLAPESRLTPQDDYVVSIVGGRREYFAMDDDALRRLSSPELQVLQGTLLAGWPDAARLLPALGDPASFFFVEMYSSVPLDMPSPGNVTLLGDAIHAMTPTLGRGANVAMRDGALLGRLLGLVGRGELGLADALDAYQAEMTRYGFGVVRESAALGHRLMGQNPLPGQPL